MCKIVLTSDNEIVIKEYKDLKTYNHITSKQDYMLHWTNNDEYLELISMWDYRCRVTVERPDCYPLEKLINIINDYGFNFKTEK